MIITDQYAKEIAFETEGKSSVYASHTKCGEESLRGLNLFLAAEWAEKHRHLCPEFEVEQITASNGDHQVHVRLDEQGRTVVQSWNGTRLEKTVVRRLVFLGKLEEVE